jgi:hypothetical protein
MSTTDETTTTGGGSGQEPGKPSGFGRAAKRYGPIVLVVAVIAAAVAFFGGKGGDDDDSANDATNIGTEEELIRSGPMTPAKADLEGKTVDFGDGCDTKTGRIKLVSVYAPPCVEPFTGDNGGATSPGVTADSVKVVYYRADPALDPLNTAAVGGAGADTDPQHAADTVQQFVDLYNKLFETYGRKVDVEVSRPSPAGCSRPSSPAAA